MSSGVRSGVWVKDRDKDAAGEGEITRFVNVAGLRPDQTITGITMYEFDTQYRLRVIRVAQEGRYQGGQSWELHSVSTCVGKPAAVAWPPPRAATGAPVSGRRPACVYLLFSLDRSSTP